MSLSLSLSFIQLKYNWSRLGNRFASKTKSATGISDIKWPESDSGEVDSSVLRTERSVNWLPHSHHMSPYVTLFRLETSGTLLIHNLQAHIHTQTIAFQAPSMRLRSISVDTFPTHFQHIQCTFQEFSMDISVEACWGQVHRRSFGFWTLPIRRPEVNLQHEMAT